MSADPMNVSDYGLTLREAADRLGVSTTILRKLIRGGSIPEAEKIRTSEGRVWCIPTEALESIATREGWIIDIRAEDDSISVTQKPEPAESVPTPRKAGRAATAPKTADQDLRDVRADDHPLAAETHSGTDLVPSPQSIEHAVTPAPEVLDGPPSIAEVLDLALLDRLLGAKEEAVEARVQSERNLQELDAVLDSRRDLAEELSTTRDQLTKRSEQYQLEQGARAVAEAQVAELRQRVSREAQLAEVERAGRAEAAALALLREREATRAAASLGWWSRRKYRRLQRTEESLTAPVETPGPTIMSVPLDVSADIDSVPTDHQSLRQPLFGRSSPSRIPEA